MTDATQGTDRHPKWKSNPFATLVRLPKITLKDQVARMEMVVEDIHLRPGDVVHGGIYATMLDTVCGYAAYTAAPEGIEVLTIQLNMNMTATARLGETLVATAKAVHVGRKTSVVNGEIRLPSGKLLVTGSATFFYVDGGIK
jgi:uncharacterized protein (TIGR00369 family)